MPPIPAKATLKILKGSNAGECYQLAADQTLIGRESQCDVVLPRSTISRQHARIVRDAEGYFIEDLESLNGTFVDSTRIVGPTRLRGGEHLQIDEFLMSFRQAGAAADEPDSDVKTEVFAAKPPPADRRQDIRSTFVGRFAVLSGAALRCEVDPQIKLEAVLDIIRNVGTSLEIDEVLRRILDTLFQIFPQADRGYVFLADGDELQPMPCAVKHRVCEDDPSTAIGSQSNALAAEAATAGVPLLYTLADDSAPGRSGIALGGPVRATMAAPMLTPSNATVGVIQLETEDAGRQFIDQDLELLACIGSLVGQLIAHAQLIEKNRAEAALAREHAATDRERRRLRAILDLLPVGVFISNAHGKILEANPEAKAIWGGTTPLTERPEDYAAHYRAWRPGSERPLESHEFPLARALSGGAPCRGEELEIEGFDGRRRTILAYASAIREDDEPVGALLVNVDISPRKRAEEALNQANQRKDEFLAMLGHELRNPLAPLVSALAVIAEDETDAATLDWARRLMERQVAHMVRLVDDLLDVSRIERGKFMLRPERVEFGRIVAGAIDASRPLIESRGQRLEPQLPAAPLWLMADPVRLSQVITNLLNNAAKYTEPGGTITLSAHREKQQLVFEVRDTGIGIAADMLPRIFEPFTQARQTLDRAQGGLGIGLSLVSQIVKLHGGEVSARSGGWGHGATFTVRLPIVEYSPVEPPAEQPATAATVSRRVLVVDDHVGQAQVLAKLFKKLWGHDVAVAHDGLAAWEAIQQLRPDVVVMDIGLPGIDGYELVRRIRHDPQLGDTLVVALTGYGQEEDQRRSHEAGFDLHLVKPPSVATLKEVFAHPKLNRHD